MATALQQQAVQPQYGVSQPICVKFPTEKDLQLTRQLDDCLRSYGLFESDAELQRRMDVLRRLNAMVKKWVRKVSEGKVQSIPHSHTPLPITIVTRL